MTREQLQPRPSVELFSAPAVVRAEEAVGSGAAKDEEMGTPGHSLHVRWDDFFNPSNVAKRGWRGEGNDEGGTG